MDYISSRAASRHETSQDFHQICLTFSCDSAFHRVCYQSAISLLSVCYQPAISLLSVCYQPAISLLSVCYQSAISLLSACYQSAISLLSACYQSAISLLSVCYQSAISLFTSQINSVHDLRFYLFNINFNIIFLSTRTLYKQFPFSWAFPSNKQIKLISKLTTNLLFTITYLLHGAESFSSS